MDGFDSFDEEYKVRTYDQELLDIFYLKEGVRLTTEGTMEFPPEIEKRFAQLLTKNYNKPLKVIRGVEQMVDEYPDSIEIKYQLFSLYQGIENNKGVKKILRRMVEEHPNEILSVSLFMDRLFEPEELKKYEYLLGEGREASSFFGADNEVYAGDYCEYQLTACHYETFTGDFVNAKRRVRILLDIGFGGEDAEIKEMMQKIAGCMVYEIGKREEEYRRTGKIPKKDEKDEEDEPEVIDDRVELLMQEHITAILMKMKEKKERMELGLEEEDYWEDYWEDEDGEYPYIEPVEQVVRDSPKVGRNDPCPCGSGKKYKKCCL